MNADAAAGRAESLVNSFQLITPTICIHQLRQHHHERRTARQLFDRFVRYCPMLLRFVWRAICLLERHASCSCGRCTCAHLSASPSNLDELLAKPSVPVESIACRSIQRALICRLPRRYMHGSLSLNCLPPSQHCIYDSPPAAAWTSYFREPLFSHQILLHTQRMNINGQNVYVPVGRVR